MKRTFLGLIAVSLTLQAHGADESRNPPASLFLHAWIPETGPPPYPLSAEDAVLVSVADLARRGNPQKAISVAENLFKSTRDNRTRYTMTLFRAEAQRRQFQLAGGAVSLDPELRLGLMKVFREQQLQWSTAARVAARVGEDDTSQVNAVEKTVQYMGTCLENAPGIAYGHPGQQLVRSARETAAHVPKECADLAEAIASTEPETGRVLSRDLMQCLAKARIAAVLNQDLRSAEAELKLGLKIAEENHLSDTAALWLVRLGDLKLAPRGSPLSLGYQLSAEPDVQIELKVYAYRKRLAKQRDIGYEESNISPESAEQAYTRAEAMFNGSRLVSKSDLAVRRAYLAFIKKRSAAVEFISAADLAASEGSYWNEVMARACAGLMAGSRANFEAAVRRALSAGNYGGAISAAQVALAWATREAQLGDRIQASDKLHALAIALSGLGLEETRSQVFSYLADIDQDLDRGETELYDSEQAVAAERRFLVEVSKAQGERLTNAPISASIYEPEVKWLIGQKLLKLINILLSFESQQGLAAVSERRSRLQMEARQLLASDPTPEYRSQSAALLGFTPEYDKASIDELLSPTTALPNPAAAVVEDFRRRETCTGILSLFSSIKPGVTVENPLSFGPPILASSCEESSLAEARQQLNHLDPVEPIRRAVTAAQNGDIDLAPKAQHAVNVAYLWFRNADLTNAGATLDDWTRRYEDLVAKLFPKAEVSPEEQYFRARALALTNQFAQAREMLMRIQTEEPYWSKQASEDFRLDVVRARFEAEVKLGHALEALLASEQETAEKTRSSEIATGVKSGAPDSAELAMLLRRGLLDAQFDQPRIDELFWKQVTSEPATVIPSLAHVRSALQSVPRDATLLVYYPMPKELAIIRIDAGRPPQLFLVNVNRGSLLRRVRHYDSALASGDAAQQADALELHRILLGSVGPIAPSQTLGIVAASRLGNIPFEMLRSPLSGRALMETNPVVYLSRLAPGASNGASPNTGPGLFVIGINAKGLQTPESEASDIAKLLGIDPLLGEAAISSKVREGLHKSRVIHVATHGVIDSENTYRSYLLLANGRLEAWDLFREAENADLVVFSACDTRRGPRQYMTSVSSDDDSLSGLASRAGNRRILSSLWGADDVMSKNLMEDFYRELLGSPSQPATALQRAKLTMMRSGANAQAYANFVLSVRSPQEIHMPSNVFR